MFKNHQGFLCDILAIVTALYSKVPGSNPGGSSVFSDHYFESISIATLDLNKFTYLSNASGLGRRMQIDRSTMFNFTYVMCFFQVGSQQQNRGEGCRFQKICYVFYENFVWRGEMLTSFILPIY